MRFRGQPIEIRDRYGRIHRGIMDGFDPPRRGVFIRDDLEEEDLFLSF